MISRILRFARPFAQPQFCDFLNSAVSGVLIAAWLHQTVALLGTSLFATTALLLVTGIAVAAGLSAARSLNSPARSAQLRTHAQLIPLAVLAVAGFFSGQLTQLAGAFLTWLAPAGSWPAPGERFFLFLVAQGTLLVPMAAAVCLASLSSRPPGISGSGLTSGRLAGLATGIGIAGFGLVPVAGAGTTAIVAAVCALVLAAALFLRKTEVEHGRSESDDSADLPLTAPAATAQFERTRTALFAASCGVAFACVSRILDQLFFDAAWITAAEFAALLFGAAIGLWLLRRESLVQTAPLWAAVCLAILVALFPAGIRASLGISAFVSNVAGVALWRSALIGVAVFPIGTALAVAGAKTGPETSGGRTLSGFRIVSFLGGVIAARWLVLTTVGPVTGLAVVVGWLVLSSIAVHRQLLGRRGLVTRPAFAAGLVAVLTIPFWMQQYDPVRAGRLLFDTGVFLAHRVEHRTDILEHLDEARCLETLEGDSGTLSLWRSRGTQLQIRESGMPRSSISVNTTVAPQPSGEALQAILPLVLHEKPASILFLGLGTGATLKTVLQFPVAQISCVEPDSALIDLVSREIFPELIPSPLDDERVTIVPCEPVLALASARNVDIIVCSTSHLSQPGSASKSTAEFLTRAASALSSGGLFCQQFRYIDFGAETVQSVFATWQTVFDEVVAIETAPGEWLLVGSPDEAGIFRDGFVERLQRQHVRHALSQTGFDWATPLQLTVVDGDRLHQHLEQSVNDGSEAPQIQTVASASMLAAGPWDVMRWAPKFAEVQRAVGPASRRLAMAIPNQTAEADVQRRLSELKLRRKLIHEKPDFYQAYRGELRRKIQESPRAEIVQVSGGGKEKRLHPEERRRLDYLRALGQADPHQHPPLETLLPIEQFQAPYDPFVSFFMHQELAELASRNPESAAGIEFRHRLYRVNFTSARDRSIRNLVGTINLLCDHPHLVPDEAERGDQLDALLQLLHRRWQNRGDVSPDSFRSAMNDIQNSLEAGEQAFDVLKELGPARGKSAGEVALRKVALEKSLMRPLRTYRTRLQKRRDLTQALRSR